MATTSNPTGEHRPREQRSSFETAKRLTSELPMHQRAPWLVLGALGDLWGVLAHRRHRS